MVSAADTSRVGTHDLNNLFEFGTNQTARRIASTLPSTGPSIPLDPNECARIVAEANHGYKEMLPIRSTNTGENKATYSDLPQLSELIKAAKNNFESLLAQSGKAPNELKPHEIQNLAGEAYSTAYRKARDARQDLFGNCGEMAYLFRNLLVRSGWNPENAYVVTAARDDFCSRVNHAFVVAGRNESLVHTAGDLVRELVLPYRKDILVFDPWLDSDRSGVDLASKGMNIHQYASMLLDKLDGGGYEMSLSLKFDDPRK